MQIATKPFTYHWQADWADIPSDAGHAHHGLTMMRDGNILTGHASRPECLVLSPDGAVLRRFDVPVENPHGLACSIEDGEEIIWVTDNVGGAVVKCDAHGRELARLTKADFPLGEDDRFACTATSVDPTTGELWVADGYGSSTVHKFSPDLRHLLTLTGDGGLGRFKQPHWVFVDLRSGAPRIYVADRAQHRVQVFKPDGSFMHGIDEGLETPSVFDRFGDYLVIGELTARIVICDRDDRIVAALGNGRQHCDKPGWPNRLDADGAKVPPHDDIPVGEFNSPHGVCCDQDGNIYVSEWLLGDRYTKLVRHN